MASLVALQPTSGAGPAAHIGLPKSCCDIEDEPHPRAADKARADDEELPISPEPAATAALERAADAEACLAFSRLAEQLPPSTAATSVVTVSLEALSGRRLVFNVESTADVAGLKGRAAEAWGVPNRCQTWVVGSSIAEDGDSLSDLCQEEEEEQEQGEEEKKATEGAGGAQVAHAHLSARVLFWSPFATVEDRMEAVAHLKALGTAAGDRAITAAARCLEDLDDEVRMAAGDALAAMVQPGDTHIVDEIIARVTHRVPGIRFAALLALTRMRFQEDPVQLARVQEQMDRLRAGKEEPKAPARVRSLSGEMLEVSTKRRVSVGEVKDEICNSWQVPVSCQRILLGQQLLQNGDLLSELVVPEDDDEGAALELTMVVCLDSLQADLDAHSSHRRISALRVLQRLKGEASEGVQTSLAACLGDDDAAVRYGALTAMSHMAERSDLLHSVAEVARCLEHVDPETRSKAQHLLLSIAGRGDTTVAQEVAPRLDHARWEVRCGAVETLAKVVEPGDTQHVLVLVERLRDPESHVRRAAVQAVTGIIFQGSPMACVDAAVAAITACLKDQYWSVKDAAVNALALLNATMRA